MSSKCTKCGKTVYPAEKQAYDGKDFHGLCLSQYKKEALKPKLYGYYPGDEDRISGSLPSSSTNKGSSTGSSAPSSGAAFCPNCGTKSTGEKFCANCGNKL